MNGDGVSDPLLRPAGTHRGQYYCANGPRDRAHHPRYTVRECDLLPWVKTEVARLRLPVDAVELATEHVAERADLTGQRERLALVFARGGLLEDVYTAEDTALEERIAALGDVDTIAPVSPIRPEEWDTWSTADLNVYLRSILRYVKLGPDMRPVEAPWRNPKLRGDSGA